MAEFPYVQQYVSVHTNRAESAR